VLVNAWNFRERHAVLYLCILLNKFSDTSEVRELRKALVIGFRVFEP
jgi:hypothetical protein